MGATGLVYGQLSERVICAFHDVYNESGHGFLESIHENAFAIQLERCGFEAERQQPIVVRYRGQTAGEFHVDIIVADSLIVEIRAVIALMSTHQAQLMNYLKATGIRVGLLLDFGPRPRFRRRIR